MAACHLLTGMIDACCNDTGNEGEFTQWNRAAFTQIHACVDPDSHGHMSR